jgi:hypothetical protein
MLARSAINNMQGRGGMRIPFPGVNLHLTRAQVTSLVEELRRLGAWDKQGKLVCSQEFVVTLAETLFSKNPF